MASDGFTDVFDTDTAKKSSDLSATTVEFTLMQIRVLQRRAGAKVGWDFIGSKVDSIFPNDSSAAGGFDCFLHVPVTRRDDVSRTIPACRFLFIYVLG
jgi:hypothetical protein